MPYERRKHSRWRRFVRHNRELITGGLIFLVLLLAVAFLFYYLSSSRFVNQGTAG